MVSGEGQKRCDVLTYSPQARNGKGGASCPGEQRRADCGKIRATPVIRDVF